MKNRAKTHRRLPLMVEAAPDFLHTAPRIAGRFTALERAFYSTFVKGKAMSADQKHHVNIVGFKTIDYRNKKTNAPEQMKLAQYVVTSESAEKGQQVVVGALVMSKSLHDTPPGQYLAEFELAVGQDLRIGSRLTKLHPIGVSRPVVKQAPSA